MAQKRTNIKKNSTTNIKKNSTKSTSKKPTYKKSTNASKSTNNKKYISRPINSKNKPANTKSKNNYYKNLYKNKFSRTNEVVIDNKTYVLPKHDSFETYFCVWRMYSLTDPLTKKSFIRKFWIVIGKGHKSYRKFESQRDAIRYFRNLKKYAKMKIQGNNSKEFLRTIYTIFEMIYQGINTSKVLSQSPRNKNNNKSHEDGDYVDEYTQLDLLLNNDDTGENNQEIEEDIDKVINEKEGNTLVTDYKLDIDEDADKKTREIQYEQTKQAYDDADDITKETTKQFTTNENTKTVTYEYYNGETKHLGLLDRQMDDTPILGQTQINYFDDFNQIKFDDINQIKFDIPSQSGNTESIYKNENVDNQLQPYQQNPNMNSWVDETPSYNNEINLPSGNTESTYKNENVDNQLQPYQQNPNMNSWVNETPSYNNEINLPSGNTEVIIYKSGDTATISTSDSASDSTRDSNKTSLYDLITNDNKDFPETKSNDLELEEDVKEFESDLNIIQHNTSLNKTIHDEKHKRNHKKVTIITVVSILGILVIGLIVVILLFALKIIKI